MAEYFWDYRQELNTFKLSHIIQTLQFTALRNFYFVTSVSNNDFNFIFPVEYCSSRGIVMSWQLIRLTREGEKKKF